MTGKELLGRFPYKFFALYALIYMCNAVYNTFIPVYLDNTGFSESATGTLLALGPFMTIISQPIWGSACDRATYKNTILKIVLLGSSLAILLYPGSTNYYYLFAVMSLFMFFQTSVTSVSDAITLEYLYNSGWKFGPIRMAGTIGFAIMSIVTGSLTRNSLNLIFPIYFLVSFSAFLTAFSLPKVKGHQSRDKKISFLKVFKYPELTMMLAYTLIIQGTLGFYYSFFPIYYKQLGADTTILGLAYLISALSEIPFLLFAEKILSKLGPKNTLLLSGTAAAIRWFLIYAVTNVHVLLLVKLLHGFTFIVLSYTMATYINRTIPKELRASGQAAAGVVGMGVARIIGSVLGGFASDLLGIKQVFLYNSLAAFAAVAFFGILFMKKLVSNEKTHVNESL